MVLLNALVVDIVFEAIRLILMATVMVLGIFAGKKLRSWSDARKSEKEKVSEN